jgi:molecular chaperone GrpE (heat shock protein)
MAVLQKSLITIANQMWRIASSIIDTESKEIKSELSAHEIKKVGNSLESIKETLGGVGLRVIDRLGESFNAGLPEQVVTEETQEGLSKEQIIRTIRPTIMWHQTMVQRGEIDVAVPAVKE